MAQLQGAPVLGAEGTSTAPIDLTALDRRVSSLLSSVEIVAEETSSQLERVIDDTSRGAPLIDASRLAVLRRSCCG